MSTPTFQHAEIHGSYRDPSLPVAWSAPEHAVWRFSQLSEARKHEVIERKALALGVRAYAYVNAGRWLVSCPFAGCNSAQYASFADRWPVGCRGVA